jgi:DNA repair protein RadD
MKLRDYQEHFIQGLRGAFASHRRALGVMPTGSGKTACFSYIAKGVQAKGNRVLIVAHRRELLRQISRACDDWRVPHAVLTSDSRGTPSADVVIASIFTFVNRMAHFKPPRLIIVDEAHHAAIGTTWGRLLTAFPESKVLGVTATPLRLDGKGLGDNFDTMVMGPSVAELTAMGWLTPAEVYAPRNTIDLRGIRISGGDYSKDQLAAAMDKPSITGDAVDHYMRLAPGRQAVAFCCSIQHAEDVAAAFRGAGMTSEHVDGKMEDWERDGVLMRFARGTTKILTSCDLISEGFDCPAIEVAILLRPTKSLGLYMQQVGRAIRPSPGKTKTIVLDHAGNTAQHGFVDDVRKWQLNTTEKKQRQKAPAITVCPDCYAIHSPGPVCPRCGHIYTTTPREVAQVDGTLEQIRAVDELDAANAEKEWQRRYDILVNVAKHRNIEHPQSWAFHTLCGQLARQLAKDGREPGAFMINGLTPEERDRLMQIVRGTQNQVEMVL